jgi:hypothetical protein
MFQRLTLGILFSLLITSNSYAGWGGNRQNNANNQYQNQTPALQDQTPVQQDQTAALQDQTLTVTESEQLSFLREEEKMARDVYLELYRQWNLPAFNNIAAAEQRHMDSVLTHLNRYGLVDTALAQEGSFSNTEIQNLYDSLVAQGSASQLSALQTGALIEEVDMQDLNEMIAATDKEDLINMYENLLCGSRNHLRAFVRQIENLGVVYTAQVINQGDVDNIIDTPMERGCGR